MLVTLGVSLALAFQVGQVGPPHRRNPVVKDSVADSASLVLTRGRANRHEGRRAAVTPELLATAFKDPAARTLLLAARHARLAVDSALLAYDAMSYQRFSAGMGFGRIGRDRLMYRHESAMHIRWQRNVGAWVDVTGFRTGVPMAQGDVKVEIDNEMHDPDMMAEIPYYPGYEPLWVGSSVAKAQVDETELVHPIADGAEAYYTYATGDSVSLKLPNGHRIQLRELKVRPRKPKWNLGVGSLWFDTGSGQLVRAAYRLSVPMDIWAVAQEEDPKSMDDVPVWVKPLITPMKAQVSAIAVEYGLFEGRFWLPRARSAEGDANVSFMHIPFKIEESFKYASVNGRDTLPAIVIADNPARPQPPDSLSDDDRQAWRDSVRAVRRARVRAENDSIRHGLKERPKRVAQCDTAQQRMTTSTRFDGALRVAVRVPCDPSKLEHSPDLPGSIYDSGEELFGSKELDELKSQALSLTAQAPIQFRLSALPAPTISYGPSMMRYNRIEGFSLGASVEQQVGGGYSASAVGRFGFADHEPNVELNVTRTNLTRSIGLTAYNHLVSASDWGHPLSFGSSFSALFFGRDEGFYYRATGVELSGSRDAPFGGGMRIDWRAFTEQERNAAVHTNFAVNGSDFPENLTARRGAYTGVGALVNHEYGLDPTGLRVSTDLRLEAAAGDSTYGRGALEVTMSHGLGTLAGALTLSGGSSLGGLPPQRRWYLGGSQTVRGQSPDTAQSGNAYWLTRAELGAASSGVRPAVFADLGWVGDRSKLSEVGRPMSGVGAGVSFLDGLFRFDVARGLYPRKQFRVDLYLTSRF
jgi:hemolysin secretion/activation protein ShlB/FhaC/HecB